MKPGILKSLVRTLVVISFTPVLSWAQAEINPDHFDGVSDTATIANKATPIRNASHAYGSLFLPFDLNCAGARLTRGYYSLSVRQSGRRDVVRLTPIVNGYRAHVLEVTATPQLSPGAPAGLLVHRVSQRRMLTAIRLEQPGVTLLLQTGKEAGTAMDAELVPFSFSGSGGLPASGD